MSSYCSSLTLSGKACVNNATHFEGNCVVHHNYKRRHDPEYRARYTETPERKAKNKEHAERMAAYARERRTRSPPRYYGNYDKMYKEHKSAITRSKHKLLKIWSLEADRMEVDRAEREAHMATLAAERTATATATATATS